VQERSSRRRCRRLIRSGRTREGSSEQSALICSCRSKLTRTLCGSASCCASATASKPWSAEVVIEKLCSAMIKLNGWRFTSLGFSHVESMMRLRLLQSTTTRWNMRAGSCHGGKNPWCMPSLAILLPDSRERQAFLMFHMSSHSPLQSTTSLHDHHGLSAPMPHLTESQPRISTLRFILYDCILGARLKPPVRQMLTRVI
jgi:hypothetical protein